MNKFKRTFTKLLFVGLVGLIASPVCSMPASSSDQAVVEQLLDLCIAGLQIRMEIMPAFTAFASSPANIAATNSIAVTSSAELNNTNVNLGQTFYNLMTAYLPLESLFFDQNPQFSHVKDQLTPLYEQMLNLPDISDDLIDLTTPSITQKLQQLSALKTQTAQLAMSQLQQNQQPQQ